MKVKLNLIERVALATVLPREASFKVMVRSEELKKTLLFSDKEDKEHGVIYLDDGRIFFQPEQFKGKKEAKQLTQNYVLNTLTEFDIGETVEDVIVDKLKELDKNNKLPIDYVSLYTKFIEK